MFYALLVDARRVGVGTDFGDALEVLHVDFARRVVLSAHLLVEIDDFLESTRWVQSREGKIVISLVAWNFPLTFWLRERERS